MKKTWLIQVVQTKHLSIPNTIVGSKEVRFRQVFTLQINCKQFISAFSDHIGQLFLISIQAENDYGLSKQSGPRYIRAGQLISSAIVLKTQVSNQCARHTFGITFIRYVQSGQIGKPNKVFGNNTTKVSKQDSHDRLRSSMYERGEPWF